MNKNKQPTLRRGDGTTVATTPATTPATVATTPAIATRAFTVADIAKLSDVTIPDGYAVPAYIDAWRDAFRHVAGMPSNTITERIAVRDAMVAFMTKRMPGQSVPTGRHTGRFTGMPVFESQNTLYVCAALANVPLTNGHIMASWATELPNAACGRKIAGANGVPYVGRDYAWSTLSEYVNGRHNGCPAVPGAVVIVTAWSKRDRKPLTA